MIGNKLSAIVFRLFDVFRLLPLRLMRLFSHLRLGFSGKHDLRSRPDPKIQSSLGSRMLAWWGESLVYLLECFGIGEIYETLMDFVKFNTRPLTEAEIELAQTIYGDNIRYKRVRVDEYALIGPRQAQICYVSFFIINNWKGMSESTLIHELMHVWQYEHLGAVYMPRALRAQFSEVGYNYGGVAALKACLLKGQDIRSFNLEQQADIVEDFFRIQKGLNPCWGHGTKQDMPVYQKVLAPVLYPRP